MLSEFEKIDQMIKDCVNSSLIRHELKTLMKNIVEEGAGTLSDWKKYKIVSSAAYLNTNSIINNESNYYLFRINLFELELSKLPVELISPIALSKADIMDEVSETDLLYLINMCQ